MSKGYQSNTFLNFANFDQYHVPDPLSLQLYRHRIWCFPPRPRTSVWAAFIVHNGAGGKSFTEPWTWNWHDGFFLPYQYLTFAYPFFQQTVSSRHTVYLLSRGKLETWAAKKIALRAVCASFVSCDTEIIVHCGRLYPVTHSALLPGYRNETNFAVLMVKDESFGDDTSPIPYASWCRTRWEGPEGARRQGWRRTVGDKGGQVEHVKKESTFASVSPSFFKCHRHCVHATVASRTRKESKKLNGAIEAFSRQMFKGHGEGSKEKEYLLTHRSA